MAQALEYIVGTSPVPGWIKGRILPYKRMDGDVGYELRYRKGGRFVVEELLPGDTIVLYGGEIYIQKEES